jgi:hypothetical protein
MEAAYIFLMQSRLVDEHIFLRNKGCGVSQEILELWCFFCQYLRRVKNRKLRLAYTWNNYIVGVVSIN